MRARGRGQTRTASPSQGTEGGAVVMHAALAPTSPVSKEELQAVRDLRYVGLRCRDLPEGVFLIHRLSDVNQYRTSLMVSALVLLELFLSQGSAKIQ